MALYKVLDNINSGQFKPGQTAEFDDASAKALLSAGVIEPAEKSEPAEKPKSKREKAEK